MQPGRNDSCHCGSGLRFKACCGRLAATGPAGQNREAACRLNLGNALGRRGQLEEAAACFRQALELEPQFAEAYNNLGDVQLERGRLEEALDSCRRAIEIKPRFAAAHHTLARVLLRSGRPALALDHCRQAIGIAADFAEAHNTLGNVLMRLGEREPAMAGYRRAISLMPDLIEAHLNLANAERGLGRLGEAAAGYHRALRVRPQFVPALVELATTLRLQRRGAECEAACARALELSPDSAAAVTVLAELRADEGRFAAAEDLFRRATGVDPASAEGWAGIARSRRMTAADRDWLAAVQRLAGQDLAPSREALLRYALGKYFDDTGAYAEAFANYRRANELAKLQGPGHDRAALTRMVDWTIRTYDGRWFERMRAAAAASDLPVFVVGMLRSGTTLAEQIMASHPAVAAAGELPFWGAAVSASHDGAASGLRDDVPELAGRGHRYLRLISALAGGALRVVDKMPTNFFALGLIGAALPHARIIHMRRDPIDTCLSIYFQNFEAANTYANDLGDLAHYAGEYQRLMRHWQAVLPPGATLDVPYEGLVEDPEGWSRKMLRFIGLPWDARCLEFHRSPRTVITASKWQVRQAISRSSVGRWRRYEEFAGPLRALRRD